MLLITRLRYSLSILLLLMAQPMLVAQETIPPVERVLVPLTARDVLGAYGSRWTTELWMYFREFDPTFLVVPSRYPVTVCGDEAPGVISIPTRLPMRFGFPCTEPGEPPGTYFYVSTKTLDETFFSLRVRETTKDTTVEIPVVRQHQFESQVIPLMGIPTAAHLRSALRVYSSSPVEAGRVLVRVFEQPENRLLHEEVLHLRAEQKFLDFMGLRDFELRPPAAEMHGLTDPYRATASMVWLEVVPIDPIRIWAFVSVTDVNTNHVSLRVPR